MEVLKRNWTEEEFITDLILMPDELNLLMGSRKEAKRDHPDGFIQDTPNCKFFHNS